MTLQEKELLTRFLQLLSNAQAGQKDAEAEALIREACARQPDAAYLLVQRTIQLEQLLQAAQAEVEKLKASQASPTSSSFLGDPYAWGRSSGASTPQQTNPGSQPIPGTRGPAAAPMNAPMAAAPAQASSWGSGLFGNIAATAAGVVAGSFLFQGIESLMHHGEHPHDQHAFGDVNQQQLTQNDQPELLNTYDESPLADSVDNFPADDSGDFA